MNVTTKVHPAAEKQQINAARPGGAEWNFKQKKFEKSKKKKLFWQNWFTYTCR